MKTTRRRWPLWVLLTLVLTPVVEVAVLIAIGRSVGWWPTLLALIAIAALGAWLVRREGPKTWKSLNEAFRGVDVGDGMSVRQAPTTPSRELSDGALVLIGALLLLLPGFLTDIAGIVCLLPATRPLPRRLFTEWVRGRAERVASRVSGADGGAIISTTVIEPPRGGAPGA